MNPIVAATGDIPQHFAANGPVIFVVLGVVVTLLWIAMLLAAFRRRA